MSIGRDPLKTSFYAATAAAVAIAATACADRPARGGGPLTIRRVDRAVRAYLADDGFTGSVVCRIPGRVRTPAPVRAGVFACTLRGPGLAVVKRGGDGPCYRVTRAGAVNGTASHDECYHVHVPARVTVDGERWSTSGHDSEAGGWAATVDCCPNRGIRAAAIQVIATPPQPVYVSWNIDVVGFGGPDIESGHSTLRTSAPLILGSLTGPGGIVATARLSGRGRLVARMLVQP